MFYFEQIDDSRNALKIVDLFGNLLPAIPGAIVIWNHSQPLELERQVGHCVFWWSNQQKRAGN